MAKTKKTRGAAADGAGGSGVGARGDGAGEVPVDAARPSACNFPDEVVERILRAAADVDFRTLGALLGVSQRFRSLGYANAPLWRAALAASGYGGVASAALSSGGYLESRLTAAPRATVAALLTSRCSYCPSVGGYWFTLQHRRVCVRCFQAGPRGVRAGPLAEQYPPCRLADFLTKPPGDTGPAPPRCAFFSKSLAKATFLLTEPQLAALPALQLTGEDAKRSGCAIGANPKISLVTSGDCLAAAVARFGSEAALAAEARTRLERATAAFEAKTAAAREDKSGATRYPAANPNKTTCNFPHLNQANGLFSYRPVYGLRPCPPRNAAAMALAGGAGPHHHLMDEDDEYLDDGIVEVDHVFGEDEY